MPIVGSPDIERSLGTAHAVLAAIVFVVPGIIGLAVEPVLFLLSDRYPRHWFIRGGIGVMALGALLAAIAPGPITLALAIALTGIASGAATGIAQATLVDQTPHARGRTLARWTMWSLAGDLVAPVLLATLALAGVGWRAGYALVGALLALCCVLLCLAPIAAMVRKPDSPVDGDAEGEAGGTSSPGLFATLRAALRDRLLIAWLFGVALCDLLDEILVVFASLHVRIQLGASAVEQGAVIGAFMIGGALGLVALDRLLRVRGERWLLVAASIATIVSFVPWMLSPNIELACVLALPVGAASTPLYPLAAAQAYALRPEQSGSVLAAGHLFTPLGLALPFLIGVVADQAGTTVALALLVAQPVGLIALVAQRQGTDTTSQLT